ncbi:MAG: adenosylcobinamide-GDP ribazoletransferase [Planctomycetota bacterium]
MAFKSTWAGLSQALRFLLPSRAGQAPCSPAACSQAVRWIVPLGLGVGLVWAASFRLSWRVYGEIAGLRVMPALTIVLVECLLTGLLLVLCSARTVDRMRAADNRMENVADDREPLTPFGTLTLLLIVLTLWALIISIPREHPWWPSPTDWRYSLKWLYPAPIYRPLILAPLWGRWGILLAASIGRAAPHAEAQTVALSEAMRPTRLLLHTILPTALTAVYCSRDGNIFIGVVLSLFVFGATFLATVVIAQRCGGQTRNTLFAAGQVAQLMFLVGHRAMWPIIHG